MASLGGVEPLTYRLGGGCSILLSYSDKRKSRKFASFRLKDKKKWRTREDSNLQPPESESVTLSIELRAQLRSYSTLFLNNRQEITSFKNEKEKKKAYLYFDLKRAKSKKLSRGVLAFLAFFLQSLSKAFVVR